MAGSAAMMSARRGDSDPLAEGGGDEGEVVEVEPHGRGSATSHRRRVCTSECASLRGSSRLWCCELVLPWYSQCISLAVTRVKRLYCVAESLGVACIWREG